MVDGVDLDTRMKALETDFYKRGAGYTPPPSVTQVFTYDTTSKALDSLSGLISTRSKPTSIPVLDVPKPLSADADPNLKKLIHGSDEPDLSNIENVLNELYLATQKVFSQNLRIERDLFNSERAFLKTIENERMEEMQKQIDLNQKRGLWDKVEKSLLSLGLIAAGVVGVAMGFATLGASAILVGSLLILDHALDDAAKRAVATWLAKGDNERQETYMMRINLFCSGVSMALAFAISPAHAATYGLKVAQVATSAVKSVYEWRQNVHKSVMVALGGLATISQQDVNNWILGIQNSVRTLLQHNEMTHEVEERNDDTMREIARSMS